MKSTQMLKFKGGIEMPLNDRIIKPEHLELINELIATGDRYVIRTIVTNRLRAAYRDERSNKGKPLNFEKSIFENGLGVTKYYAATLETVRACEILGEEIDLPILVNVNITPEIAYDLIQNNDGPFVLAGCHIMNGNLNVGILGESGDVWMDDAMIEVPKFKNEPCVSPGVKLFKDLMDVVSDDVSVPAVTLKQLQDKAIKYDVIKKELEEVRVTNSKMIEYVERYERVVDLSNNTDPTTFAEFCKQLRDIIDGKEEPETFDRADYRDE